MIASEQDILTALGLASINVKAKAAWSAAENAVKQFLGWHEVELNTWFEYFVLTESMQAEINDPSYIKSSTNKSAVPGWFMAPNRIQLRSPPVREVLAVYEDPTAYFGQYFGQSTPGTTYGFETSSQLTQGPDYFLIEEMPAAYGGLPISWSGLLERRGWWFPAIPGSILVQYTSGFTLNELNGRWTVFKEAVQDETADRYLRNMAVAGGQFPSIASEGLGGGASTTYRDNHQYGECVCDIVAERLLDYRFHGQYAQ